MLNDQHNDDPIILQEGDWQLLEYKSVYNKLYSYYYLRHHCSVVPYGSGNYYRYYWYQFRDPCSECKSMIPDPLQAMYVFLSGEMRETT
jgi:hypothetical protein